MLLSRNKKTINTLWLKKVAYLEMCLISTVCSGKYIVKGISHSNLNLFTSLDSEIDSG